MKSRFTLPAVVSILLSAAFACEKQPRTDFDFDRTQISLTQKELRGAWFATVWNIDWPKTLNNPAAQKKELTDYFDFFRSLGIDAVFFQIRGSADAFYDSEYEPWSKVFTGERGRDPGWDPLQFAVEEAHRRGLQLHVWMNPYRIATRSAKDAEFPPLDSRIPPALVKDYAQIRMYNPALPETRQRIADIIKDVITRYRVDGVHYDDYFYPSQDQCQKRYDDEEEFRRYGKGCPDIETFRFENVNRMVKESRDVIVKTRPEVVFSISPSGNTGYNRTLYADVPKWCEEHWIDVLIPQLYWDRKYFDPRLREFTGFAGDVPVMIGYGTYRFGKDGGFATSALFRDEYRLASTYKNVVGSIHYNSSALKNNAVGITDMVRKVYEKPHLLPYLGRTPEDKSRVPGNLRLQGELLSWDGEGVLYGIYRDRDVGRLRGRQAVLIATTARRSYRLRDKGTYYVTAVSKDNSESYVSDYVEYK